MKNKEFHNGAKGDNEKMVYENLEKELNSGKLGSLYLIYGEEEYLIDKALKKIKKNFGELLKRNELYKYR